MHEKQVLGQIQLLEAQCLAHTNALVGTGIVSRNLWSYVAANLVANLMRKWLGERRLRLTLSFDISKPKRKGVCTRVAHPANFHPISFPRSHDFNR